MPEKYFCTKCQKNHASGKIYDDHKKYAQKSGETSVLDRVGIKPISQKPQEKTGGITGKDVPDRLNALEQKMVSVQASIRELQGSVLFLREQWTENHHESVGNNLSTTDLRSQLQKQLGKIPTGWQSIDAVWNSLPFQLQNWGAFQSLVEELSDEHVLNVSAGESKNQVTIRGERYGIIRRN